MVLVRAGGLEPPQALLPYGFSYQLRLSPPSPSGGAFVVWTIPSPCSGRAKGPCRRVGAARLVSTPSPSGPARHCVGGLAHPGLGSGLPLQEVSPSLGSSASGVSPGALKSYVSSPLRLPISPRPRDTPLYRPG